eukprot:1770693-Pyramimonas_sp.AAC.1
MALPRESAKPARVTLEVRKVNGPSEKSSMNTSGPARSPARLSWVGGERRADMDTRRAEWAH